MKQISSFFSKVKETVFSGESIKENIIEFFFEELGVRLSLKDFKINRGVLFFSGSSVFKNEVFLNKEKILSQLESRLGKGKVIDIR